MATLQQIVQYSMSVLGETQRKIGEKNSPTDLTVNGQIWDSGGVPVADAFGQATLWQSGNGGLTSFAYLIFTSDVDVVLEVANTTPNPDERALFLVKGGTFLIIPSTSVGGYANNTSRLDGSALVLNTDYGLISEIRVQRDVADLAGNATVRLVLIS